MNPMAALYDGICGDCEERISEGEMIVLAGGAGWVHNICPRTAPPRPLCDTCFLEIALNGSCGCEGD